MSVSITFLPHYKVIDMEGDSVNGIYKRKYSNTEKWKNLHDLFERGVDELNLIIGSTSGVHGTSFTLDDIEKHWDITDEEDKNYYGRYFTYLAIQPRLCVLRYGNIEMRTIDDIKWMRQLITNSVYVLGKHQHNNTVYSKSDNK